MSPSPRQTKAARQDGVIALALTWDGARWPRRSLPKEARTFLAGKSPKMAVPPADASADLFAHDRVKEIRVCWVPRLQGGPDVLSAPFATSTGKRLAFAPTRTVSFGDVLGVVYRRR